MPAELGALKGQVSLTPACLGPGSQGRACGLVPLHLGVPRARAVLCLLLLCCVSASAGPLGTSHPHGTEPWGGEGSLGAPVQGEPGAQNSLLGMHK